MVLMCYNASWIQLPHQCCYCVSACMHHDNSESTTCMLDLMIMYNNIITDLYYTMTASALALFTVLS